ncbi:universal stress protein UspA-like protein [Hydrococcus rivularis NIES-593]|uniref:Universal stress protein UspA-like protein n=1 Tax=Hydrococcus rivularis NIES-593 TaxID=1921803 RepID=A0A1U7HJM1_9CYAN|nr:universal stress protein [Hydrococcus rivularis]OKH23754.1 universal stress protein UspA-like protein [Hydrococcus rivularis NIES-593]
MFQHCLICTDFSDGLHRLTDFVPDLASSGLKRIVFLHIISVWQDGRGSRIDEEQIAAAKERLSAALTSVPEGVEVKVEVALGRPVEKILRAVETHQIDVVFVGTPIRSLLEEKILGSTSAALTKLMSTPLIVLRPELITTYTREELSLRCRHLWRYLLIPYNDGKAARYLIERIKEYAKKQPEKHLKQCMLVWVVSDGLREKVLTTHRLQEAQKKLESVKAELEALGLEVNTEVRQGNPLLEILNAALYFDISAIAIATDRQPDWLELAVPCFARDLLRRSWFPVLFFSADRQN